MRAMKDSGVDGIGSIPENWNVVRLRSQFTFGKGLAITKKDLMDSGIGVISYGQVHSKDNHGTGISDSLIRYVKEEYLATAPASLVQYGDFIFADTSEDVEGCGNCVFVDRDEPLFSGYHTLILKPKDGAIKKYFAYLFATDAWRSQVRALAMGVKVFSITQKMLRDTKILMPPEKEQLRIVEYLDEKCSEIDSLVAAKEKNNELLRVQRRSIIYEAVTKGLNTSVSMKNCGVEYLGNIPTHWKVWRMKHLATEALQYGANATGVEFNQKLPRYVRITDVNPDGKLSTTGMQSLSTESAEKYMLKQGDILFARSGATAGKSFYYEDAYGPCCFAGYLIKFHANAEVALSKFLYYYTLTEAYERWTQQIFIQATIQNISADKYNNLRFAIPPLEEQAEIVDYLDTVCEEMDDVIARNATTIQELKEYRQSLIYEAVTGKIEV